MSTSPERRRRPPEKPHLRRRHGTWWCQIQNPYSLSPATIGSTPQEAYRKWRALMAMGL
jgi:hypothetical protein